MTHHASTILVRYRVHGGPVNVDQRVTVFDDGTAELDERHRSRDSIRLELDAAELERLRAALEAVPAERWSRSRSLSLAKVGTFLPDFARVVELLDELRLTAIRSEPR